MRNPCTKHESRRSQSADGCFPRPERFHDYASIVRHYIGHRRNDAREELDYFRRQPNLRSAIREAALARDCCGNKHPHQWRIPRAILGAWKQELTAREHLLGSCTGFDDLMKIGTRIAADIPGIGELTIYDTMHRIGAYLRKAPTKVFLHAGTRTGANALQLEGTREFVPPAKLPPAFRKLKPYEIEDCLCIYKDDLRNISNETALPPAKVPPN